MNNVPYLYGIWARFKYEGPLPFNNPKLRLNCNTKNSKVM